MHGLIFETSVCYWQNQPGCYLTVHTHIRHTPDAWTHTQASHSGPFFHARMKCDGPTRRLATHTSAPSPAKPPFTPMQCHTCVTSSRPHCPSPSHTTARNASHRHDDVRHTHRNTTRPQTATRHTHALHMRSRLSVPIDAVYPLLPVKTVPVQRTPHPRTLSCDRALGACAPKPTPVKLATLLCSAVGRTHIACYAGSLWSISACFHAFFAVP